MSGLQAFVIETIIRDGVHGWLIKWIVMLLLDIHIQATQPYNDIVSALHPHYDAILFSSWLHYAPQKPAF